MSDTRELDHQNLLSDSLVRMNIKAPCKAETFPALLHNSDPKVIPIGKNAQVLWRYAFNYNKLRSRLLAVYAKSRW